MEGASLSFLGGVGMSGAGGSTPEGDGEVAGVAPTSTSTDVGMICHRRGIGVLGDRGYGCYSLATKCHCF